MAAKYPSGAQDKVQKALHEEKEGTLKIGKSDKKITSRKQAIAIGLSEAREEGKKVPEKKTASKQSGSVKKSAAPKKSMDKKTTKKKSESSKKTAPGKSTAPKKATEKKST